MGIVHKILTAGQQRCMRVENEHCNSIYILLIFFSAQDNGETEKKLQWTLMMNEGGRGPPGGNRIKANRYRASRHGKPRKPWRQKWVTGFIAYLFDGQRHTYAILFNEDHVPAGFWRLYVAVNSDDGWTGVVERRRQLQQRWRWQRGQWRQSAEFTKSRTNKEKIKQNNSINNENSKT